MRRMLLSIGASAVVLVLAGLVLTACGAPAPLSPAPTLAPAVTAATPPGAPTTPPVSSTAASTAPPVRSPAPAATAQPRVTPVPPITPPPASVATATVSRPPAGTAAPTAAAAGDGSTHQVRFTVAQGPAGITYRGEDVPGQQIVGPAAFTVAPDGTV